jgi:DNA polymerase-1
MALDSLSLLNRAFYGMRPLSTKDGLPTGAIYGFLSILCSLLDKYKPAALCAAFDLPEKTFRHKMYDGYKATRRPMPEDLAAQLPLLREALAALCVPVLQMPGYEADDILGAVSRVCGREGWRCAVVTGDRDSFQLICADTRVIYIGSKDTVSYNEAAVEAKYGLTPAQLVDLKALMGDSSDNIPGVPGVGEKTATALMREYGSLDAVYANTHLLTGKLREKMESGRDSAYLSQELGRINTAVPIVFRPDDAARREPDDAALNLLLSRLEFGSQFSRRLRESTGQKDSPFAAALEERPLPQGVYRHVKALWKADMDAGRPLTPCEADISLAAWLLQKPEGPWEQMKQELADLGLWGVFADIEMPLCEVLASMEHHGVAVDGQKLTEYGDTLSRGMAALEEEIYALAGARFNINSSKQLGELLYETLMLPGGKKNKIGWVTDADTLQKLRRFHPIIPAVLDYRALAKLKSTYADGLLRVMDTDGRVRSTFHMTATVTGRLSSSEPNLQNIPVRTETGRLLRGMFIPSRPDWVLIDADYSQIELRVLAHIAGDGAMKEAFRRGEDIHAATATQVFGESNPTLRRHAKAVNFGIVYGISPFSLAEDIGVPVSEAKRYMESYLEKFAGVRAYMANVVAAARESGYVTTLFGRRRYLPELYSQNHNIRAFGERAALNAPIQGTAADIIKKAMVAFHRRLKSGNTQARLILQVHDELIAECPESESEAVAAMLREEMENACPLDVPLVAQAHAGKSWLAAK